MAKICWRLVGHRLRTTRLVLGITDEEAADVCGVTLRTYRQWEAGGCQKNCPYNILPLAEKYDISLDWLLLGETDHVGKHLARGAKGSVAILPAEGPQQRKARKMWGPIVPKPAA